MSGVVNQKMTAVTLTLIKKTNMEVQNRQMPNTSRKYEC